MKTAVAILGTFLIQFGHLIGADQIGFEGRSDSILVSDYAENPLINYYLKTTAFVDGYQHSKATLSVGSLPDDLGIVFNNARKAATDFVQYYEKNRLQKQNKLPFVVALANALQSNSFVSEDTKSHHALVEKVVSDPSRYLLSATEIAAYCEVMRSAERD